MKTVTIWERQDDRGIFDHNHISDGFDEAQLVPIGNDYQTKSWKNGKWKATKALLNDNNELVYA